MNTQDSVPISPAVWPTRTALPNGIGQPFSVWGQPYHQVHRHAFVLTPFKEKRAISFWDSTTLPYNRPRGFVFWVYMSHTVQQSASCHGSAKPLEDVRLIV
jgi:hypothetical protein